MNILRFFHFEFLRSNLTEILKKKKILDVQKKRIFSSLFAEPRVKQPRRWNGQLVEGLL